MESVVKLLETKENDIMDVFINKWNGNISIKARNKRTYLYIRKSPIGYVLANIDLENQRQGTLTSILDILIGISKAQGFSHIKFESVMSDAMVEFCKKNNFYKVNNCYMFDGLKYGDYILDLA